jgi:Sulfotransferase domain
MATAISHTGNRPSPTLLRRPTPASIYGENLRYGSVLPRLFQRRKVDCVDFIVGGVQKAGTTAIHDFLAQHPHVALLRDQALHFFDKEKHFQSPPDYRILHGNFKPGLRWRIAGEVTADYLYYPQALERIANYNREVKLVVSLRNPTERAFSQWNMRRDKGQERLEFLDALKRDEEIGIWKRPRGNGYIARSLYAPQLEKIFLVLKYEELRRDPSVMLNRLFDFLGLRGLQRFKNRKRNVGSYSRKLTVEEREYAAAIFEADIGETEELLGWDCRDWRSIRTEDRQDRGVAGLGLQRPGVIAQRFSAG